MYSNIGGKIKGLAIATFVFEAIASVITGIIFAVVGLFDGEIVLFVLGLPIIFIGPVVAWISTWVLYGFGELISKTTEVARNTRTETKKSEAQAKLDAERISRIERLRSQGLITEAEYQQAVSNRR